ncbi:response regulator [Chloroflexota bacterium]
MESDNINILIADDHPLIRQALKNVLAKEPEFHIVGEASNGEEVISMVGELKPDVVIMDISMPKINGLEATRHIKAEYPNVSILVLTVYDSMEHVLGILEAGAAGYLTKSVFDKEIIQAIRGVTTGDMVLSKDISVNLLKHALRYPVQQQTPELTNKLTTRELEVLRFAATGLSNKDIAYRLEVSIGTIKGHLMDIFNKMNVGSRTEAVIMGIRSGLITLDDLQ